MWRVGHALDMRSRVHLRYKTKYRVSNWAELMMRVFREDVLRCKKCGGRAAVILRAIYQGNVLTPLALVQRFLPTMLEQSGGTILNML
jgi:hypothetical protein